MVIDERSVGCAHKTPADVLLVGTAHATVSSITSSCQFIQTQRRLNRRRAHQSGFTKQTIDQIDRQLRGLVFHIKRRVQLHNIQ